MIKKLINQLNTVLYIQIWRNRIKVTNITTGLIFEEKPLVAVSINSKGQQRIEAIGNDASLVVGDNIEVINPFDHPRSPIANFQIAESLLLFIFSKLSERNIFQVRPNIVIHPMEQLEGGITDIEERAFKELGIGAGARNSCVYIGDELSLTDFNYDDLCPASS